MFSSKKMTKSKDVLSGSVDRFGYEWNKYSEIIPEYEKQFLGWIFPLKKEDFKGKLVLDAGCGIGRNSFWPLKYGAKKVVGFDFDERTVKVARKNLESFKNCQIFHNSIYDINFKDKFDIAFSIGVIHHLAEPRKAIANLVKSVKRGGKVLIWVYGYENNEWVVKYINPLRKITSKLPLALVNLLSYFFSIPLYFYLKIFRQKHPYMKNISKFRLWHLHSIVFDQLIPKIANYWKKDEALALFNNQGLNKVKIYNVNGNSWSVIGEKI